MVSFFFLLFFENIQMHNSNFKLVSYSCIATIFVNHIGKLYLKTKVSNALCIFFDAELQIIKHTAHIKTKHIKITTRWFIYNELRFIAKASSASYGWSL